MVRKNTANFLTLLRVLLAPILVYFIVTGQKNGFFWFAVGSMFTDAIDGTVARVLHAETDSGRMLDSVADFCFYPIFAIGTVVLLRLSTYVPIWIILIPLIMPVMSTAIVPIVLVGRMTFLHLRSWQASSYAFLLFAAVSFLSNVSVPLFYLFGLMSVIAGIEEIAVCIRDGKHLDSSIHSFFDTRPSGRRTSVKRPK